MEAGMGAHDVVIAGGGPTGLMLAGELALAGVDVVIVERRANQEMPGARAGGLHARTIEILDQRGIAERFLAEGKALQVAGFGPARLDISDFPTRHNYGLGLWQNHIERILAGWVAELGVPIHRSCAVTGFEQDEEGVDVTLDDGQTLRARYLVGCDGGRSVVRKLAGIEFAGWQASVSSLIAEAELAEEAEFGLHADDVGTQAIGPMGEGNKVRIVLTQPFAGQSADPGVDELKAGLVAAYGSDFGVHDVTWLSRFTDMARQAVAYRKGRVLLAGDAAHVHSPVGGQGLNIGVQDAVNLGWKLGQVVKGISPETLLDTYHAERHPIAARVLRNTLAQIVLGRGDERTRALNEIMGEVLAMDEPRKRFAGMMSGLDIHYDLGEGHELLGRRVPDFDIVTDDGAIRLYSLLHDARPVLIGFDDGLSLDIGPWADRVQTVRARYDGIWDLPVIGTVSAPGAVLIRPDGYVAWVADGQEVDPTEALQIWFGPR